jgi:hypothetical protein
MECIAEALDDFKSEIMPKVRDAISALKAEYPDDFKRSARIGYLKGRMTDLVEKSFYLMADYERLTGVEDIDTRLFVGGQLLGAVKTIGKLQDEVIHLRKPPRKRKDDITDDDIRRAREYPFEELYEFKRGMALCPFHDDRNPSFSLHNNRATCFGSCGKTWDTISFVMEKEGLSFIDAVKRLR